MITRHASLWAAVLLSSSVILGCMGPACENKVIYGTPSPDGAVIAFIFHRTCGAASSVSTHVSIVAFQDALRNDTGNVLAVNNQQPVKISWRSPKNLLVTGFKDPIYQHTQPIDSVTVEFR